MKIIVFEINEIPLFVLSKYNKINKNSNFLKLDRRIKTLAEDLPENEIYPSQTWASMNTGIPYSNHKVKWFSNTMDPNKLYWHQIAKSGKKVSIVGALHSSPASKFLDGKSKYTTFIPDFFSNDTQTYPEKYEKFQKLNTLLTIENRRSSKVGAIFSALKEFLRNPSLKYYGLNNFLCISQLTRIIFSSIFKNKERLRLAQFSLSASIFFNSIKNDKPDLAILFSNHVASMMHRYLHAYINPDNTPYSDDWVNKYKDEVQFAIKLADEWLGELLKFSNTDDYGIVIASSMGQKINTKISKNVAKNENFDYILKNPVKLLKRICGESLNMHELTPRGVMVPQYSFDLSDKEQLELLKESFIKVGSDIPQKHGHYTKNNEVLDTNTKGIYLHIDIQGNNLTLTTQVHSDDIKLNGIDFKYKDLGFEKVPVDTHHSGEHDKEGLVWSNFDLSNENEIDYLSYPNLIKEQINDIKNSDLN